MINIPDPDAERSSSRQTKQSPSVARSIPADEWQRRSLHLIVQQDEKAVGTASATSSLSLQASRLPSENLLPPSTELECWTLTGLLRGPVSGKSPCPVDSGELAPTGTATGPAVGPPAGGTVGRSIGPVGGLLGGPLGGPFGVPIVNPLLVGSEG
ncbi:unnamed protein product [Cyprideis torosa]|uniref:Uncharacterized protein n=1 Tax=Cyprideis torosa TaxID=163714 RepID=A0A7R8WP45_9CRUS|nr:unnamed protein product [Cyprideis torosa]CAG0904733.1 unnamed protein product [Cyprideis torosa]